MELLPIRTLDPLYDMPPKEAAAFVRKCERMMREHAGDARTGQEQDEALSALEMIRSLLVNIRPAYPAERTNIDEVLRRHGYSIIET
jgi:alpha-galactosidase/6-phospho-beta-glucosidase family protein